MSNDARRVLFIPDGFIALDYATHGMDEVLRWFGWAENIVFQDSDEMTIFQTSFRDRSFIVRYRDDYYVNEKSFNEISEFATSVFEQRNTLYSVGDIIKMRGSGGTKEFIGWRDWEMYSLEIVSVERDTNDKATVYLIEFSINPTVKRENILGFFDYVKTQNGNTYNNFILRNPTSVYIRVGNDESIDILALNISQRELLLSVFQDTTRFVSLK